MKNRTEEYWDMINELAQPPKKLEGSVQRAQRRARRDRLLRRLAKPLGTLAAAAACFVLMVNAFPTFALACSGLPIIRELTAAVAFSPSLSAAVAHEYVQYIGQSRTVDGVTVSLECAIVDQVQAVFFYSVDGAWFYTSPNLTDVNGKPITGYGVSTSQSGESGEPDSLDSVTFVFPDGNALPDRFTMEMFFMPEPKQNTAIAPAPPDASLGRDDPDIWRDPQEDPGVLRFTFDVALDPSRISEPKTVAVGRWMELDDQRILVDRLEYTPTRTILYLGEDEANTAWLKSVKFWFEDETGERYDNIDGSVSATGEQDSQSMLTYYFQSFYYDEPKGLTLCVGKAEWLDKDVPHAFVDLTTGEAAGLPEGVEIGKITRAGNGVELEVCSPQVRKYFAQSFGHTYWDPEGGEHSWNRMSFDLRDGEDKEAGVREILFLDDYTWDSVELEPSYTSVSEYERPVRVPLSPQS